MIEFFRDIEKFPSYQVSNLGRVYSLPRTVGGKAGSIRSIPGKILNQILNNGGYPRVFIKRRYHLVHRFVAEVFLDGSGYVNHKDGDKTNCQVDNLEFCTASENVQHAIETGLRTRWKNQYSEGVIGK